MAGEFGEKIPVLPSQDGGAVFRVVEFGPEGPWIDTVGSSLLIVTGHSSSLTYTLFSSLSKEKRTRWKRDWKPSYMDLAIVLLLVCLFTVSDGRTE